MKLHEFIEGINQSGWRALNDAQWEKIAKFFDSNIKPLQDKNKRLENVLMKIAEESTEVNIWQLAEKAIVESSQNQNNML